MSDFYVSTSRGNDSTGTGSATNPWATIGKAIGSSPAMTQSGAGTDLLYIEPGVYFESVTLGLTPTSGNPLEIIGDSSGAGFLAGGYATPVVGAVVDWASFTNETTQRNAACLIGAAKNYVTLRRLKMIGGNSTAGCVDVTTGNNWTILDCNFLPYVNATAIGFGTTASPATAGLALTIERCDFLMGGQGGGRPIRITVAEAAAEYSLDPVIRNCTFIGQGGVQVQRAASNGLGFLATGLTISHCSFYGSSTGPMISVYGSDSIALATPNSVTGCLIRGGVGISASLTSQVVEDWNVSQTSISRQNVNTGATTRPPASDLRSTSATGGSPDSPCGPSASRRQGRRWEASSAVDRPRPPTRRAGIGPKAMAR